MLRCMSGEGVSAGYKRLTAASAGGLISREVGIALGDLCEASLEYVRRYANVSALQSKVPGKQYAMARRGQQSSRPINTGLYAPAITRADIDNVLTGLAAHLPENELQRHLYTAAMSYPVARDLLSVGDKKSPGTFFEVLIGHIAARKFGINPQTSIHIPSLDIENTLPTDFIFDFGVGNIKVHMPVKISTRERVVQAWAHQRVLEGMHGQGRFRGVMVILAETNKQKDVSVVEVCLPGQWAAYQMYISRMHRIYYFDLPKKYEPLRSRYPYIAVLPFARFFSEYEALKSGAAC